MEPDWDEYIRENIRYDPETGLLWWTKQGGPRRRTDKPVGCFDTMSYLSFHTCNMSVQKRFQCHRVAWFLHWGEWPSRHIDHINNDRSDNRIANLRLASSSENGMNMLKRKGCTSQYKGVSWCAQPKKWRSKIMKDGVQKHLGYYDNEEEAARAYDKAAKEIFGEYANLNFPESEHNAS
jgi:hypothetical protein